MFSRSRKKDIPTEADLEANRARIQAAIDRALQMPEEKIALREAGLPQLALAVSQPAAEIPPRAVELCEPEYAHSFLKQFLVADRVDEHAA